MLPMDEKFEQDKEVRRDKIKHEIDLLKIQQIQSLSKEEYDELVRRIRTYKVILDMIESGDLW